MTTMQGLLVLTGVVGYCLCVTMDLPVYRGKEHYATYGEKFSIPCRVTSVTRMTINDQESSFLGEDYIFSSRLKSLAIKNPTCQTTGIYRLDDCTVDLKVTYRTIKVKLPSVTAGIVPAMNIEIKLDNVNSVQSRGYELWRLDIGLQGGGPRLPFSYRLTKTGLLVTTASPGVFRTYDKDNCQMEEMKVFQGTPKQKFSLLPINDIIDDIKRDMKKYNEFMNKGVYSNTCPSTHKILISTGITVSMMTFLSLYAV
ncbi:uncharacterized protein LOC120066778 [Salvelinus namaycush]|uniref:Uncharacterized protein LOC120066778 n=1 Tax=Salvelinus namaycush TaxID=8040 RepID=A0A8U1H889_SALNM|nr:uncharacterized protein LOC120066778 [Salvelinus namaycush]